MANSENENFLYFDISKQERDSAIRYLLGAIIKCRSESKYPSNCFGFDEDVNVYMAHLLFAVSLPEYHEMAEPYLSMSTSDVLRWVRATEDRTIRYFIFKVNADHILIHTAVFGDLLAENGNKFFKRSEKHFHEVSKLYYEQAAAYHRRIYRKKTGVGDVLAKLGQNFQVYQAILKKVRREYFHFLNTFRDQAFHHFVCELQGYESEFQKKSQMDTFLDLYAQWLETKNMDLVDRIRCTVTELKRIDPGFDFDVDRQIFNHGGMRDEADSA